MLNEFLARPLASRLLSRASMRYLRPLFIVAVLMVALPAEARRHKKAKPHRAARVTQAAVAPKKSEKPPLSPLERAVLERPIGVPVAAVAQENDDETPGARRKK